MSLTSGTRLGPYQVVSAIGAGGMGEVYKATDIRLNRTVAIKVLPSHFAANPEMKQRFEREAQTIAGLNHRHICTLHDVGEQEGVNFLVMECLEGETLASRISRGPLPVDEALRVALEMIDALDKAHRQGVIHRDLKPANVMLTKGGTKLLDFGLAKWAASGSDGSLSAMPTRADMTGQGMILGTLQYMAPEQVEGKEADARTDIFAFGAVLYEMLTGKRAFEGKSQASLIGAIMKGDPRPISHVAQMTPPVLDHVVRRCLAKDPEERWQSAHDLAVQLAWIARGRTEATISPAVAAAERKRNRIMLAVTAVALFAAVALAAPAYLYMSGPPEPDALRFRQTIIGLSAPDISISPDGRWLAFVAKPDTSAPASIFVRNVGGVTSRKIEGTDNAAQPFWSPDSKFIGYVISGKLRKVDVGGSASQDITEAKDFTGGAWSEAGGGTILFGTSKGLSRVSAEGGQAQLITGVANGETGHYWPSFLPDGRHYTYLVWRDETSSRGVYVGALDSKETKPLLSVESNAIYARSGSRRAAPGYIFFRREGTLFAQPFDTKKLAFAGEPFQLASGVAAGPTGRGLFDVSQAGALIYYQGTGGGATNGRGRVQTSQFGFVDRSGGRVEVAIELGLYGDMAPSPDGELIAVTKQETATSPSAVWVVDWRKAKSFRLTTDQSDNVDPVWSPDGKQIAFTSYRKGNADIYIKNSQNVGEELPFIQTSANESIEDWSRDGKYVAFECGADEFQDICAAAIGPDGKPGKPFVVVQGHYQKNEPQFSFDSKWIAYTSDINSPGKFEVFVQSFPSGDTKQQISTDGGGQPRWRQDSKELYYRALDNRMMAVDLKLGAKIEPGVPHMLFNSSTTGTTSLDPIRHMWAAMPDGQRFVTRIGTGIRSGGAGTAGTGTNLTPFYTPPGQTGGRSGYGPVVNGLTVLLHWTSALSRAGQ